MADESSRTRRGSTPGLAVTAAAIGVLGALGNLCFREAIILAGAAFDALGAWLADVVPLLTRFTAPFVLAAGGVALYALSRLFPEHTLGYGFPRFLEMVNLEGRVKKRWMIVKTIGAAISLGAGASVGREGPIAQIGGSIGSAVADLLRVSTDRAKLFVVCGAAAGLASTFNAPIASVMFAQEILLHGEMQLAHFSLIVIATTSSVVASRAILGADTVFHVRTFVLASYWELLTYALMGGLMGLLAVGYTRLFHVALERIGRLAYSTPAKLIGGLALVGMVGVALPQNLSDGYPTIDRALNGALSPPLMGLLSMAKIFASTLSLGCGAPGGVFGPMFFIGAMGGGAFRALSALILPGLTGPRGSYALVGMGTFLAACTHAPLTAIFLLMEMTGDYEITLPALITAIIAVMVSSSIEPESIDTLGLARAGTNLRPPREQLMDLIPVSAAFHTTFEPIPAAARMTDILHVIGESRATSFPVLDTQQRLIGTISVHDIRRLLIDPAANELVVAADLCDANIPTVTPATTLGKALGRMESDELEEIPVVDPADPGRILGLLSRADVIRAYNRTLLTVRTVPGAPGADELPQWSKAYRVTSLPVPPEWLGRSLRELDFRAHFNVSVLAVQKDNTPGRTFEVPDPDRTLLDGEWMVLAGPSAAVRALERTINASGRRSAGAAKDVGRD
ncbi:MAG TPA: chloride channel protein [Candidatus Binatia bacterium]